MQNCLSRFRVVTLEHYYGSTNDSEARSVFSGLTNLRACGYGPEYVRSFLPLDSIDFIATHHLVCVENGTKLEPVAGYRTVFHDRLEFYGLTVPLLASSRHSDATEHALAIESIMADHRKSGRPLASSSYMTIRKDFRSDNGLKAFFRHFGPGSAYFDLVMSRQASFFAAGTLRFKTEGMLLDIGFKPLQFNGQELGPFNKRAAGGEPIVPLYCPELNESARKSYERIAEIFSKRLIIGTEPVLHADSLKIAA